MKRLYLLFLFVSIALNTNAEPIVPPDNVLATFNIEKERAQSIVKQWKQTIDLNKKYSVGYDDKEVYYRQPYFVFSGKESKWSMEILSDGRLMSFQNSSIIDNRIKGLDQPMKPAWDQKKAGEVASEFVHQMLGEMPKDITLSQVTYSSDQVNEKYKEGDWQIFFRRVAPDSGYKFDPSETIFVRIIERTGPYGLYIQMPAKFTKVDFTPISKEEGIEAAYKEALKMTSKGQLAYAFKDGTFVKDHASATLLIVKPNYFGERDVLSTEVDLNARLAWVVGFPWLPNGQKFDPDHIQRGLFVYIDAQNKKWLGGDAANL